MVQSVNRRNGKIEFLRFLFAFIIVFHHSRALLGDEKCIFLGGSLAVDFFFIVSGYLMMKTIEKQKLSNIYDMDLGKETILFIWKKFKSVYPDVLIAWIIAVCFVSYAKDNTFVEMMKLFVDSVFEVTLLKMSGLSIATVNGVTWYISSMLLCMIVLYPIIRKYHDMMVHVGLPLIVLLTMGYLCAEFGEPRNPRQWIGFTYKENLRALAEISLGAICYQITVRGSKIYFSRLQKIMLSFLENGLYIITILYMYYCKAGVYDYFFILLIAVAVTLSFMEKGIDADLFNCPLVYWLGKYSLPLYLGHTYYAQHLNLILPEYFTDNQRMAMYIFCAIATASFIWGMSKLIKTKIPNIYHFFKAKI